MTKQPPLIPARLGVSPDLLTLISDHARATRIWEMAQNKADRRRFATKKHLPSQRALDAAADTADDKASHLEISVRRFKARSLADLVTKLQFADRLGSYSKQAAETRDWGAKMLAAIIADAQRLVGKGGAA